MPDAQSSSWPYPQEEGGDDRRIKSRCCRPSSPTDSPIFPAQGSQDPTAAVWHGMGSRGRVGSWEEHRSPVWRSSCYDRAVHGGSLLAPTRTVTCFKECPVHSRLVCAWVQEVASMDSLLTTFHVSPWFQKDEPSSRLNKVPPMGAPKAAATPAAAPADTKSRLSLRKRRGEGERAHLLFKKEPSEHFFIHEPYPSQPVSVRITKSRVLTGSHSCL